MELRLWYVIYNSYELGWIGQGFTQIDFFNYKNNNNNFNLDYAYSNTKITKFW